MIKQLLNIVFNVSKQMVLVYFRSFGGMPFDAVAFLGTIRFSSLSISDKPNSFNGKLGIFFDLLIISKTLLIVFSLLSTRVILLLIFRFSEKKG